MHSARRLTASPPPRTLLVPTDVPSELAVGARRSSGQGGDAAQTPSLRASSCTIAPAGRSVDHGAREPLLSSAAQSALAHAVLWRAQRGETGAQRTCDAMQFEFAFPPFRPLSRRIGFGVAGRAATSGDGRGASNSPCASVCPVVPVLVPQYVDIGPSTHRMDACVGLFPLKSDFSRCAADAAALLGKRFFSVCVCGGGGGAIARVARRHLTAAPHPSRCNSLHGTDRASSDTHGMAGVWMSSAACCMLHVACCMLHVACCPSLVACSMLPPGAHALEASSHARTHARAQREFAGALCRYGRGR